MGRKLMRVPLTFTWPINEVWEGYTNPYKSTKCLVCDGTGLNLKTKAIQDEWYGFSINKRFAGWQYHLDEKDIAALLKAGRLFDFTRINKNYIPKPDEVNEWAKHGIGHDSINCWICVKAKAKRLHVYGKCLVCKGTGEIFASPITKQRSNNWRSYDPPAGEGYQLWENTTEGSPVSPVFESIDDLASWAENNASTFADFKATKAQWITMLQDDSVAHTEGNVTFV